MGIFVDALLDALKDSAIVLPIMYLAYLLVGFFSHNNSKKYSKILHHTKKVGPLVGAFLGCVPQCGFSSVMAQLYSNKIVTLGTLFAVFIATSDEAIPIMLTKSSYIPKLLLLLAIKVVFAIFVGYMIDLMTNLLNRRGAKKAKLGCPNDNKVQKLQENSIQEASAKIKSDEKLRRSEVVLDRQNYSHSHAHNCCHNHYHNHCCDCHDDHDYDDHHDHEEGDEDDEFMTLGCEHKHAHTDCCAKDIFLDALKHTLIIVAYVFVATLCINLLVGYCGLDVIRNVFTGNVYLQILIASFVGLIPNCAASVFLVELYMSGVIMFAPLVAGLCAGAGVGIIVLFTTNRKHIWQNIAIVASLVGVAYVCGLITSFLPI